MKSEDDGEILSNEKLIMQLIAAIFSLSGA